MVDTAVSSPAVVPAQALTLSGAPADGRAVPGTPPPSLVGAELIQSGAADVVFRAKANPQRIRLPALGVDAAVVAVGVEPDGALQIPRGTDAGWYSFGPRPGDGGASVVVGHVDYDGLPGVFYELASAKAGDEIVVRFDDGTEANFEVTDVARYDKESLPGELVWRRSGDPTLVLVTCGGAFDPIRRSYESNTVAFARFVG